jgi:Fe-Mn family superoxide dismutase
MSFELPNLPYSHDSLEPYFDARTMEIHHSKHHQAYTTNLNAAISGTEWEGKSIETILKNNVNNPAIRNNGGGFYNHNLFWTILSPKANQMPTGELAEAINNFFGSFDSFKEEFSKAAITRFGSGWAWLNVENGILSISSSPNQDNPIIEGTNKTPILGLDVWEHAYYLNYQNRRPDYVSAFFNIINWEEVARRFAAGK